MAKLLVKEEKPDAALRKLAQVALDIQDASNFTPVSKLLYDTQRDLLSRHKDSKIAAGHPITRVILNKLNHLSGLEQSDPMCVAYCVDISAGRSTEFTIERFD